MLLRRHRKKVEVIKETPKEVPQEITKIKENKKKKSKGAE